MQKNLYFRTMYRRRNAFKENILGLFESFSSLPKLTLEVFLRKNLGERYINVGSVVSVIIVLLLLPFFAHAMSFVMSALMRSAGMGGGYTDYREAGAGFWGKYLTWYLFLLVFVHQAVKRLKEVKRQPSVFDFARFSLYSGDINPLFSQLQFLKERPNIRKIEILYEPLPFFAAGVLLWLLGQSLGWLLVIGSITYSLSYAAAYKRGDDFITDIIDENILNEEMEKTLVDDLDPSETRNVRLYLRKPTDKDLRRKLAGAMVEEEEITVAT